MTTRKIFDEELLNLHEELTKMCSITESMINDSVRALKTLDRDLGASVSETDKNVDDLELAIEKKCMRLLLKQQPVAKDLIKVTTALKVITDIERIGDQASDIGEIVRQFPDEHLIKEPTHIQRMGDLAVAMVHQSVEAFLNESVGGADMVIHYDPWWNPAAEDQATDRAHRIGQTRKVEVIRLVTHDSIEEQVVALGQRKKALFDQLITPGEELVTGLTEKDIRALFA